MFRSVWDWIFGRYGSTLFTGDRFETRMVRFHMAFTFISGPILYQIADPFRTGSTRSRVNTRLIRTSFVQFEMDPVPCKPALMISLTFPYTFELYYSILKLEITSLGMPLEQPPRETRHLKCRGGHTPRVLSGAVQLKICYLEQPRGLTVK